MASVHDVATYILEKHGPMTAMKLQKLVYYAQAWSLVWDDEPLFHERIEAWANGPVCPELWQAHLGRFNVEALYRRGSPEDLSKEQSDTIDAVLSAYGSKSSQWLSDLTHREDPWRRARRGLRDGDRGSQEITHESMAIYYASLPEDSEFT